MKIVNMPHIIAMFSFSNQRAALVYIKGFFRAMVKITKVLGLRRPPPMLGKIPKYSGIFFF